MSNALSSPISKDYHAYFRYVVFKGIVICFFFLLLFIYESYLNLKLTVSRMFYINIGIPFLFPNNFCLNR